MSACSRVQLSQLVGLLDIPGMLSDSSPANACRCQLLAPPHAYWPSEGQMTSSDYIVSMFSRCHAGHTLNLPSWSPTGCAMTSRGPRYQALRLMPRTSAHDRSRVPSVCTDHAQAMLARCLDCPVCTRKQLLASSTGVRSQRHPDPGPDSADTATRTRGGA